MRQVGTTQTHSGAISANSWVTLTGTITADTALDAVLALILSGANTSDRIGVRASTPAAGYVVSMAVGGGYDSAIPLVIKPLVEIASDTIQICVPVGVVRSGAVVSCNVWSAMGIGAGATVQWELWDRSAINAMNVARPASPTASSPYEDLQLARSGLANTRTQVVDTGVVELMADDGVTPIRTLTPSEADGTVTLTAS